MYAGLLHVTHNPDARGRAPRYKVVEKATSVETRPKGVTTIISQTLAKDLMAWAVSCCVEYLRDRLPVITAEDLLAGGKAYTVKRDKGADTGSEAHALVENYLKGNEVTEERSAEAEKAFEAFVDWYEEVTPEVINVEEVIYSQTYAYAGTYDCMLKIDGKVHLCDLKTTNPSRKAPNGVYAENFIQLGAYAAAHEEQRQYELANGGTKLVEIEDLTVISAKKNGVLDIKSASELGLNVKECMDMFRRVMNIYQFMTTITKDLGGR